MGNLINTGQTVSYFPGDDGDTQRGVVLAYQVLTTGQYSGTTNIVVNGKTNIHTNNVVVDDNTLLMWSRETSNSIGPANDGLIYWKDPINSDDIFAYRDQANANLLGGHNDWLIPNVIELVGLGRLNSPFASPDPIAFPIWGSKVWSSTSRPNATTQAHQVWFTNGGYSPENKETLVNNCALVRVA